MTASRIGYVDKVIPGGITGARHSQVMVPCTTVPFLSSIVTVSLLSFIKNL